MCMQFYRGGSVVARSMEHITADCDPELEHVTPVVTC